MGDPWAARGGRVLLPCGWAGNRSKSSGCDKKGPGKMSDTTKNECAENIDVARVCELANLALAPGELETFQEQMATIVTYVRKIGELDVSGIEPTVHGQPVHNVFREDRCETWLDRGRVLANAPDHVGPEFRVPRIVE